ncbi:hypothetical protein NL676_027393 [Syzygium grande]|nr:hypothetical protein NL676_027393 [Syzygium grande]
MLQRPFWDLTITYLPSPSPTMARFSNILGCFSESPEPRRHVCNGDVCVLTDGKSLKKEKRQSLGISISFARLSMRKNQIQKLLR